MNNFWQVYFFFIVIYEAVAIILLYQRGSVTFSISNIIQAFFIVGLYGLAFNHKFISKKFWQVVFGFSVIVFLHAWIMMPLIYRYSEELTLQKIGFLQLFSIPTIPLFIALYLYAWKSENIWHLGT